MADVDAVKSVIGLLKRLHENGVSYAQIADIASDGDVDIDVAVVKQMIYRASARPRKTKAIVNLVRNADRLLALAESLDLPETEDLKTIAEDARRSLLPSEALFGFEALCQEFKNNSIFRSSRIPRNMCYLRKNESDDSLIQKIFLDTFEENNHHFFSMKIIGNRGSRVVLGTVNNCSSKISFVGFSYTLNELEDTNSIIQMGIEDIFYNKKRLFYGSPVGVESVVLLQDYIGDTFMPAAFMGIDGRHRPIFGAASVINLDAAAGSKFQQDIITRDVNDPKFREQYDSIFTRKITVSELSTSIGLDYLW